MNGIGSRHACRERRARFTTGLALLLVVPAAAATIDCTLPEWAAQPISSGPLRLAWRAEPAPIQVSRVFRLQVAVCPLDAHLTRVDATMPEHRHGMNYRPSLQPRGPGRWEVDGLLWHMPGRWELRFDVEVGGRAQDLRQSVELR